MSPTWTVLARKVNKNQAGWTSRSLAARIAGPIYFDTEQMLTYDKSKLQQILTTLHTRAKQPYKKNGILIFY